MIVIVASRHDEMARRASERWTNHDCRLITPADLSVGGWRHHVRDPMRAVAVASGEPVKVVDIEAIINRLPWVYEHELGDITPEDRPYVAAEMSAFLLSWLTEIPCPVLNRPTAGCLAGPSWGEAQWIVAALEAGMTVEPLRRRAHRNMDITVPVESGSISVIVTGDHTFGCADATLLSQAIRLAEIARVQLLEVRFSNRRSDAGFVGATPCPNPEDRNVEAAVLLCLGYPEKAIDATLTEQGGNRCEPADTRVPPHLRSEVGRPHAKSPGRFGPDKT